MHNAKTAFSLIEGQNSAIAFLSHLQNHSVDNDSTYLLSQLPLSTHCSLLDIGYGSGTLLQRIRTLDNTINLFGVEASKELFQMTAKSLLQDRVEIFLGDMLDYLPNQVFGIIVMSFFLHHLADPNKYLSHAVPWLDTNGIIAIMDRIALTPQEKAKFPAFWHDQYANQHEWHEECPNILTRMEYEEMLRQNRLRVVDISIVPNDNRPGTSGFPKTVVLAKKDV